MRLTTGNKPLFYYGHVIALLSFIALILVWGAAQTFGIFFKSLSADFGWTRAVTSGSFSLFMFVYGLLCMVSGRLSDRFGPRIVVTFCGLLTGVGYLMMSRLASAWQLYLIYGLIIAAGASGSVVPLTSTVVRWFVRRKGLMLGFVMSGIGTGAIIGPPVVGWLISRYDWRLSYFTIGVIVLPLLILIGQFIRREPAELQQLPFGEGETMQIAIDPEAKEFSFLQVIHGKQFWLIFSTNIVWGIISNSFYVHVVPHATDLGASALGAANILTVIGVIHVTTRLIVSGTADRIGSKRGLIFGLMVLLAATLWLQIASELWMFYLFAVLFGVAHGTVGMIIPLTGFQQFGIKSQGLIQGTINFGWAIGGIIGPVITGHLFDIAGNYSLAFWVLALVNILGLTLASLLKPSVKSRV